MGSAFSALDLFGYWEYRDILRDFYNWRKESMSLYSYRMMGDKLGLDSSQLFRILNKDQHLSPARIPDVVRLLGLKPKAAEFFDLLLRYNRARGEKEKKSLFEQILAKKGVSPKKLEEAQLKLFQQWHLVPIRCLIGAGLYTGNVENLGKMLTPPITAAEAQDAVNFLLNLGLVEKRAGGTYGISENHLTTGSAINSMVVRAYHRETFLHAAQALDLTPPQERHMSTLTLAADQDAIQDVNEMLRECRRQIQKRIEESQSPDRVVQVAFTIFPVAKV